MPQNRKRSEIHFVMIQELLILLKSFFCQVLLCCPWQSGVVVATRCWQPSRQIKSWLHSEMEWTSGLPTNFRIGCFHNDTGKPLVKACNEGSMLNKAALAHVMAWLQQSALKVKRSTARTCSCIGLHRLADSFALLRKLLTSHQQALGEV